MIPLPLSPVMDLWDRLQRRPKVRVHNLIEYHQPSGAWKVEFEIENTGGGLTSVCPHVEVIGLCWGRRFKLKLPINERCRKLEQFTLVSLTANQVDKEFSLFFTDFRRYRLRLTRGRDPIIYMAGINGQVNARAYWRRYVADRVEQFIQRRRLKQIRNKLVNSRVSGEVTEPHAPGAIAGPGVGDR